MFIKWWLILNTYLCGVPALNTLVEIFFTFSLFQNLSLSNCSGGFFIELLKIWIVSGSFSFLLHVRPPPLSKVNRVDLLDATKNVIL